MMYPIILTNFDLRAFRRGLAKSVDVFGLLSKDEIQDPLRYSDQEALRTDWSSVSDDILAAISRYERTRR